LRPICQQQQANAGLGWKSKPQGSTFPKLNID
jgi:hypothetical protein